MERLAKINAVGVAVIAVLIDQSTKWWVRAALKVEGAQIKLPGPIDLTLAFNKSNAFGLTPVIGHYTRWFLMSANAAVAALLLYAMLRKEMHPLSRYGLAFIVAGAIGNALDRLFVGSVVDFLDATKIGFIWIFNVADMSVDIGIATLLLSAFLSERSKAPSPAN